VQIDTSTVKLKSNGQPSIFIQPRKEEDLGTYKFYYLYQEIDSVEQYKLEAVVPVYLTPDVSKDAELDEFEIPEEPPVFETFFGPKI